MSQDIYTILHSIQNHLYTQEQKIQKLQKKINILEKKISELESRPPVHVERMEYKFDQLKVETLEGTLNIGLNPSDLQGIEDFSVNNKNAALSSHERMSLFTEVENLTLKYLDDNLHSIIADSAQQLHLQLAPSYHEFILQDIRKQLPNRIEYHLNQPPINEKAASVEQKNWIFERMQKEIQHGVLTFLQNLPENMKGMKTD